MKKSILKVVSTVMVMVAMLLIMPMTAEAGGSGGQFTPSRIKMATAYDPAGRKNVVAKSGYLYTLPMDQMVDKSVKDHDLCFLKTYFLGDEELYIVNDKDRLLDEIIPTPAGYEAKAVLIAYDYSAEEMHGFSIMTAWGIRAVDGSNFVEEKDDQGLPIVKFTINYNGKEYTDCMFKFTYNVIKLSHAVRHSAMV